MSNPSVAPRPSTRDKRPCAGCGESHPRRKLIELTEDNHDNLAYFHGDRLCRRCADRAGVAR